MKYVKYALYWIISIVLVIFVFNLFHIDGLNIMIPIIEWATRFILPWIALYWFIQFVKSRS